jgi:2-polyprenyl-3-methyl-5-hydroxy-6-metoxy-1,4-benzoquinol methylase
MNNPPGLVARESKEAWDGQYTSGQWDSLRQAGELGRYGVLSAYIGYLGCPVSLLDVGCGEGLVLKFAPKDWIRRYWGLDISQAALDRVVGLSSEEDRLICSSVEEFHTEEKFDVILFNEILYYVSQPEKQLERFMGFLDRKGVLIVSMYVKPGWFSHNKRCIRKVWEYLGRSRWTTVGEVLLRNEKGCSWRIGLFQQAY